VLKISELKEAIYCKSLTKGEVAEWSKALALGASPKGRGFEPHLHHTFYSKRPAFDFNLTINYYLKV
jgi:hypothetical protein